MHPCELWWYIEAKMPDDINEKNGTDWEALIALYDSIEG